MILPELFAEGREGTPFYEVILSEQGHVYFRIGVQAFRLAYDPIEAERLEGLEGYGLRHGQWLAEQLQTALDNLRKGIH